MNPNRIRFPFVPPATYANNDFWDYQNLEPRFFAGYVFEQRNGELIPLVGVMVTDLATKRAAATAIGLTGLFGYASSVISGWGMGLTVDQYGWDGGVKILLGCAVLVDPKALARARAHQRGGAVVGQVDPRSALRQ